MQTIQQEFGVLKSLGAQEQRRNIGAVLSRKDCTYKEIGQLLGEEGIGEDLDFEVTLLLLEDFYLETKNLSYIILELARIEGQVPDYLKTEVRTSLMDYGFIREAVKGASVRERLEVVLTLFGFSIETKQGMKSRPVVWAKEVAKTLL